jgi:ferrous iron transport protein A
MENYNFKPLCMLATGRSARVIALAGGIHFRSRLSDMGLNIGSEVRVVSNGINAGPTLVASGHARLALGNGTTKKILVVENDYL